MWYSEMVKSKQDPVLSLVHNTSGGFVLPLTLIVFIVMSVVGLSIASLSFSRLSLTTRNVYVANSLLAAESGVDFSLRELNNTATFAGYSVEQELFSNDTQGRGTYETRIDPGASADEKILTSIGRVYVPTSASTPKVTRTIEVVLGRTPGGAAPIYAIHSGRGGFIMNNDSTVRGPTYVNGRVILNDYSTIGTSSDPEDVWVVGEPCASPNTGSNTQASCSRTEPVTILDTTSWIYGNVRANGQTSSARMSHSGLVATSGVSNLPVPYLEHDRDAQKAAVTSTMTSAEASCSGTETKTWPANVHITGAARIDLENSCTIQLLGDAWIDGGMLVQNSASIIPAPSVVSTPTIMLDGNPPMGYGSVPLTTLIFNNSTTTGTNSNPGGVGTRFIVYNSRAACSPDCTSLTEAEAADSNHVFGIIMNNNAHARDAIMISKWSMTVLNNSARAGSIAGASVILNHASSSTGEAVFVNSAGGGGTPSDWSIKLYRGVQP